MTNQLLEWLVESTLSSSLLVLLILVIRKPVVRYLGAKWSYVLWSIPALRMMVPFTPQTPISIIPLPQDIIEGVSSTFQKILFAAQNNYPDIMNSDYPDIMNSDYPPVVNPDLLLNQVEPGLETPVQVVKSTFTFEGMSNHLIQTGEAVSGWEEMFFSLWIFGFLTIGVITLFRHIFFQKHLLINKIEPSKELICFLRQLCLEMKLQFNFEVILTSGINGPAVVGFFHPKLVLPLNFFAQYSKREMEFVLRHELTHIQRKDYIFTCLFLFLKCSYWFNPLIYAAHRYFRLDQELSCDQLILSTVPSNERKYYGLTLIKTSSHPKTLIESVPEICLWYTFSQLKERIIMIKHHRDTIWQSIIGTFSFLLLGFASLTYATTENHQDPSQKAKQAHALSVNHEDITMKSVCKSPTQSQKKILEVLAQETEQSYSPNSCKNWYQKLSQLTHLDLTKSGITNISLLEKATQLTQLTLSRNNIINVSALKRLTKLTHLDLSRNHRIDISTLKELTQLTSLNLADNQLTDLSVLKGFTKLTHLDLSGSHVNSIIDFGTLEGFTQLTHLKLSRSHIADFKTLKGLTQLTHLDLTRSYISDFSALKRIATLTHINLAWSDMRDIRTLKELTQLTSLDISRGRITDVSALKGLTKLTSLDLFGNDEINDISGLKGLTQLVSFRINSAHLKNCSPKSLEELKSEKSCI